MMSLCNPSPTRGGGGGGGDAGGSFFRLKCKPIDKSVRDL